MLMVLALPRTPQVNRPVQHLDCMTRSGGAPATQLLDNLASYVDAHVDERK